MAACFRCTHEEPAAHGHPGGRFPRRTGGCRRARGSLAAGRGACPGATRAGARRAVASAGYQCSAAASARGPCTGSPRSRTRRPRQRRFASSADLRRRHCRTRPGRGARRPFALDAMRSPWARSACAAGVAGGRVGSTGSCPTGSCGRDRGGMCASAARQCRVAAARGAKSRRRPEAGSAATQLPQPRRVGALLLSARRCAIAHVAPASRGSFGAAPEE